MYSQSNRQNLLFFIPYFVSWYQSCMFLRPRHHSGLHSWIFFYSRVYWNLFNSEEMEKLRSLLGSLDKPIGTCSLALSGTPSLSFCINVSHRVYDDSWIIDLGATNHMTSKSQLFHTYTLSPKNKKIAVANDFLATVAGFRDIYIIPTLIFKNVLHVPKLSANLVSIQKLTHDLKYYAIFFPSYCVFQEQGSRRRIGLAKERSGLYRLESSTKTSNNLWLSFLNSSNKDII